MPIWEDLLKFVHVLGVVFMSVPLYNLVLVNERALLGPGMVYAVDRYLENLIRKSALRCYVFQATVLVSGLLLTHLELGLSSLFTEWVLAAKTFLLLTLMGLLSYIHFSVQPRIEQLLGQVQGDPVPQEIAAALRPLRVRRKRLAGVCLFLVVSAVILGLQVFDAFNPWLTTTLIALAALFAWRVYKSPVRFGWV